MDEPSSSASQPPFLPGTIPAPPSLAPTDQPRDEPTPRMGPPPLLPGAIPPPPRLTPQYWGFWATIGWSVLIWLSFFAVAIVVGLACGLWLSAQGRSFATGGDLADNEFLHNLTAVISTPVVAGLCIFFARLRKGAPVRDYLRLNWPDGKTIGKWCMGLLLFELCYSALMVALGLHSSASKVTIAEFRDAVFWPLVALDACIGAPFAEEFLFRGFLFTGLARIPGLAKSGQF